jgi:hypothetical protein
VVVRRHRGRQVTTSDNGFTGGTKQDDECASVISAKAPNRDDLKRVYFSSKTVDRHVYLNLAWVRIPQNTTSPSAHVAFEFNQSETLCGGSSDGLVERSTANGGDVLIVYDFEGGATDTPTIRLSRWIGIGACEVASNAPPCWGVAQSWAPASPRPGSTPRSLDRSQTPSTRTHRQRKPSG